MRGSALARTTMRKLAAFGLALVALMQVVFFVTGTDRPAPYRELQVLSVLATVAMVVGALRDVPLAVAIGAGVNLLTRVLQPVFGLTRLPLWANALLAAGWTWIVLDAARKRAPRAGLWTLAVAHFLAALTAGGRLTPFLVLCMGSVGLFLAAMALAEPRR